VLSDRNRRLPNWAKQKLHPSFQSVHGYQNHGMDGDLLALQNDGASSWPIERLGAIHPLENHDDPEHHP